MTSALSDPTPIAGLLLGLASSTHCVAMCGGVASALDRAAPRGRGRRIASHLLYAAGRIGSYVLFGALAGGLGLALGQAIGAAIGPERLPLLSRVARVAVGGLLIVFALGLAGLAPLRPLERMGLPLWRRLQPLVGRLRRAPAPLAALGLGALWGFLPCGMVYGAASVAALTGSTSAGALFMGAFGLGTVPAVLGVGAFAGSLWRRIDPRRLRRVTALGLALCGLWVVLGPSLMRSLAHAHH